MSVWTIALVFGGAVLCGLAIRLGTRDLDVSDTPLATAGLEEVVDPRPVATAAPPVVPPDAPALPELANEVPALEARLASNPAYQRIWTADHRDDLVLLLSGLSQLLSVGGFYGPVLTAIDKKPELNDAAVKLYLIDSRLARLPESFTTSLDGFLDQVEAEPHMGLWRVAEPGKVPHDFAALAATVRRTRPEYLREVLAARREGPSFWAKPYKNDAPSRVYIATEEGVLERLAAMSSLTTDESARLAKLKRLAAATRVELATLLSEYKLNEIRADAAYKNKAVVLTGIVGAVRRDLTGSIYLTLGTGAAFESPQAQCFFLESQAGDVTKVSASQKITVYGRVDGLLMNVLVRDCEIDGG